MTNNPPYDISAVNYQEAINHYAQQKRQFLILCQTFMSNAAPSGVDQFENLIMQELNKESIDDERKEAQSLLKSIADSITGDKDKLQSLQVLFGDISNKELEKGNYIYEDILNTIFFNNNDYLEDLIKESLKSYATENGFYDYTALLDQARSYAKKVIKMRIINQRSQNPKISRLTESMKGYYREALIYKAYSEVVKQLGISSEIITISAEGSKNMESDDKIVFNIPSNFHKNITISAFGSQTKSWIKPWEDPKAEYKLKSTKAQYFYSIGSRADLLNSLQNKSSWTAGVLHLGKKENTLAALGYYNSLYVTGSGFNFTSDLITEMRDHNYKIAFVFDKEHQATRSITWQLQSFHQNMIQQLKN